MHSKNKRKPSPQEREHIEAVKSLPCSVCNCSGPSEAHEQRQGQWYTSIALCPDCHRNPTMGWHGERRAWKIRKMDELDALNITIERVIRIGG